MDAEAADWISAGCLSALGKPGPTGAPKRDEEGRLQCRPIAAPETLYALAAKAATIEALPDVKAALAKGKQLGVKVSSACEAIIASIEVVLEDGDEDANDERVCLALQSDATAAFQTVSRAAVLKAVHKYAPRLVPFVRLFYGKDSRLVWGRRGPGNTPYVIIVSSDGVRQGCPLAMLCFCLAYLDALKATQVDHPDVFIPSCADDTTVVGEPAAAAAAFVTLRENMKAIGMAQSAPKCYGFSAQAPASSLDLPAGTTASDNGLVTLGAPHGSPEYMDKYVADKLTRPMAIMRTLPKLNNAYIAFSILRITLLPRARYLLSVLPPGVGQATFTAWDALVKATIAKLLGMDEAPATAFLPFREGGLGLWLTADHHAQTFLRGKDRGLRAAQLHFPELSARLSAARNGDSASATGRALQRARSLLPASVASSAPSFAELSSLDDKKARDAGKEMKLAVADQVAQRARAGLTYKQRLILKLSACPGAAAFLTRIPTFKKDRLTSAEFVAAVCIRLGLPHAQLRGTVGVDHLGREVLRQKGKAVVAHDALKEVYYEISKEAGRTATKEVAGLYGAYPNQAATATKKGENRRVDMLEQDPTTGRSNMTDNFIADGAGSGGAVGAPLKLLQNAEKKKIKKYTDGTGPPGFTFTPLGSGTQCEMTETTLKWLTEAAEAVAKRHSDNDAVVEREKKRIRWRFQQHLGLALMRAQASMIFNYALATTRAQYITALPRGRRAANSRARGHAAGRAGASGGRMPAPRAGHGR
jgi:hypothetical protein